MAPVGSDAARLADAPTKRRLAELACISECIVGGIGGRNSSREAGSSPPHPAEDVAPALSGPTIVVTSSLRKVCATDGVSRRARSAVATAHS